MRRLSVLLALVASLFVSQAHADFTGKDAAAATITFKNPSGACTSVVCVPVAALVDSTGANVVTVITAGADATSNTFTGIATNAHLQGYNGTTWDRLQVDANKFLKMTLTSGAVTSGAIASGAVASGAYASGSIASGAVASGAMVDLGAQADAAAAADNSTASLIALIKRNNQNLTTLNTTAGAALAAGSATVGNVGFDPSSGKATPTSVAINVSTATTTQLVALSGSTVIYVTSFDVIAGGTGNITFEYGTGASCGTGTTALTGAYNLTAQAGIAKGNGAAMVLKVPAGNALCVLTSAAVQMSGSVSYQQF